METGVMQRGFRGGEKSVVLRIFASRTRVLASINVVESLSLLIPSRGDDPVD
jgi:hypothetical protein